MIIYIHGLIIRLSVAVLIFTGVFRVSLDAQNLTGDGLYFRSSGNSPVDQLPYARLTEQWGVRFASPDTRWTLSTSGSLLIGYAPSGTDFGVGNVYASGNLGVGTIGPRFIAEIRKDAVGALGPTLSLFNGSDGAGSGGALSFTSAHTQPIIAQIQSYDDGNYSMHLLFNLKSPGASGNGTVERMRIASNGNVGIGTANPSAKLTITGGNDDARIKLYSNGGSVAVIDAVANTNDATGRWLSLNPTGANVGIGTTTPTHKLTVNGTIRAKEVIVDTGWSDYVFASDYRLAPLGEVEQHIKENKHLPGIPSAQEVAEQGISVGDMQARLLAKIEELTLHLIAQEKRFGEQQRRMDSQQEEIQSLRLELKKTR